MGVHLKFIGFMLVILALMHAGFPKYFKWKTELASLSIMNRQMMYVHSFFIAFTVLLMGILCLTSSAELVNSSIGKRISLGLGIFWSVRAIFQFVVYSPKLWLGKTFETIIHVVFSVFWLYLSTVFALVYLQ